MNLDLFRRLSALAFAFIYAAIALGFSEQRPDTTLLFCFFSVFLLGIWLDCAMTWNSDRASKALIERQQQFIEKQRQLLELYRARILALDASKDDAD